MNEIIKEIDDNLMIFYETAFVLNYLLIAPLVMIDHLILNICSMKIHSKLI